MMKMQIQDKRVKKVKTWNVLISNSREREREREMKNLKTSS
jgi:hypothetical protein